jgi:hypothetical protein
LNSNVKLHLNILPHAQRLLWPELASIPKDFTLYGGTAIALRLGHRESIDFDFFGTKNFNPLDLASSLSLLKDADIVQSEPSTLTAMVHRGQGTVKLSFFGVPAIPRLREPFVADNGLKIASILDLAGTKVSVVQVRAELKDYLDIDAMLTSREIDLATALAAGKAIYGSTFSPQSTLKALCYFEDGNVHLLPREVRERLIKYVTAVDLTKIPVLQTSVDSRT